MTDTQMARAVARLAAGSGRSADIDVDGFALPCEILAEDDEQPIGPTTFGLLAAALSACTAMSARTFLQRWHIAPSQVQVDVRMHGGVEPEMHRHIWVEAALPVHLREQLSAVVDRTPVTVLLRDGMTILTRISAPTAE